LNLVAGDGGLRFFLRLRTHGEHQQGRQSDVFEARPHLGRSCGGHLEHPLRVVFIPRYAIYLSPTFLYEVTNLLIAVKKASPNFFIKFTGWMAFL
jgi:hypothetical protein